MTLVSRGIKRKGEEEGSVPFDLHAAKTPCYSGILIERLTCFSFSLYFVTKEEVETNKQKNYTASEEFFMLNVSATPPLPEF